MFRMPKTMETYEPFNAITKRKGREQPAIKRTKLIKLDVHRYLL